MCDLRLPVVFSGVWSCWPGRWLCYAISPRRSTPISSRNFTCRDLMCQLTNSKRRTQEQSVSGSIRGIARSTDTEHAENVSVCFRVLLHEGVFVLVSRGFLQTKRPCLVFACFSFLALCVSLCWGFVHRTTERTMEGGWILNMPCLPNNLRESKEVFHSHSSSTMLATLPLTWSSAPRIADQPDEEPLQVNQLSCNGVPCNAMEAPFASSSPLTALASKEPSTARARASGDPTQEHQSQPPHSVDENSNSTPTRRPTTSP